MARTLTGKLRALTVLACVSCVVSIAANPRVARADSEETREEAKRLFAQGSTAFLAKKYAEALEDLRASYKLVPSPNSGLLIARCLRELNRRVEAVDMYATVAADARRRAADGDVKYTQTADVAVAEGAAIRATLGTVRVRVAHPAPGSTVEIDGEARPATESEIVVLHAPGDVTVKLKPKTGAEQSQRATVAAGGDVRMEFTPPAGAVPTPAPLPVEPTHVLAPAEGEPPGWTMPAALSGLGVAVIGTGIFIGFRVKSDEIYDGLKQRCGSFGCGPEDQPTADEGKRYQTIADVGLVVGIVGAASAVAFLIYRAYGPRTTAGALPARTFLTADGVRANF